MPVVKIFIGVLLAIWNFFLPNIHQNYELPKTHPFIAKNTVTVLLLVVKMPCTPWLAVKLTASSAGDQATQVVSATSSDGIGVGVEVGVVVGVRVAVH